MTASRSASRCCSASTAAPSARTPSSPSATRPRPHKPGSVLTLLAAPGSPDLTTSAQPQDRHDLGHRSAGGRAAARRSAARRRATSTSWPAASIRRDDARPGRASALRPARRSLSTSAAIIGTCTVLGFDNATPTSGFGSELHAERIGACRRLTNTAGMVAVSQPLPGDGHAFTLTDVDDHAQRAAPGRPTASRRARPIAIDGQPGYWLVSDDPTGSVLKLQGADLTKLCRRSRRSRSSASAATTSTSTAAARRLTGNRFTVAAPLVGDPAGTTDRLTRGDGHTWNGIEPGDSAFAIGQQVALTSEWSFPKVVFAPQRRRATRSPGPTAAAG